MMTHKKCIFNIGSIYAHSFATTLPTFLRKSFLVMKLVSVYIHTDHIIQYLSIFTIKSTSTVKN